MPGKSLNPFPSLQSLWLEAYSFLKFEKHYLEQK